MASEASLGLQIAPQLPFLRRFARALTGGQAAGDALVRETLDAIVADPTVFPRQFEVRVGLYRLFVGRLPAVLPTSDPEGSDDFGVATKRVLNIPVPARIALLLTAMEGFSEEDAAEILEITPEETKSFVSLALANIATQTRARVLIVEDEPIIAMDLERIIVDLGHEVIGVAITRREAVAMARSHRPDLITFDIQLADDSSGIDAYRDIKTIFDCPSVFITAFPERLLTGDPVEPTYLVTKPFQQSSIKLAISQALFFNEPTLSSSDQDEVNTDKKTPPPTHVLDVLASEELTSDPGPLDAEISNGVIRSRKGNPAEALTSAANMEAIRLVHLGTLTDILSNADGHNALGALRGRLTSIERSLAMPFSSTSGTALGIQAQGLRRVLPTLGSGLIGHSQKMTVAAR